MVLTGGGRRIGGKYSKLVISTSDGISSPRMEQEVNGIIFEEEVIDPQSRNWIRDVGFLLLS